MLVNRVLLASPHNWLVVTTMLLLSIVVIGFINPYCED
jgi:hypothetical protein